MRHILFILCAFSITACTSVTQEEQNQTPKGIEEATDCRYERADCPHHHKHEGHDMHHHDGYPYHDFMLHF